ncbi:diguanylate cyclase [Marinicella sediminis]|uniref:diguanylate cyclase n=1 Tax=Marinicella sediminis TaxID=1792834 RepID=A0ABV7JC83_9GAMM|nr:diguanylate cyclase [Marinicella sediminis]
MTHQLHQSAWLRGLFVFVAWLTVWQLGRLVEYTDHASVWFPAAGFSFSCLLILGKRAFLPIMCAAIVITIWNGSHYQLPLTMEELAWAGLLFGLAHILPYWGGAWLVRQVAREHSHSVPKLIVTFLLVAGFCTLIATLLVLTSLVFTEQMPYEDISKTLLPFWIGDLAGVVVLSPLFSGILIHFYPDPLTDLKEFTGRETGSYKRLTNKLILNAVLILVTMLLAYLSDSYESTFAIFFLAITHMWIATTESPRFNVFSLAISSLLIVLLVHVFDLMDHVMVYQFALNVIAANALFGIAIPQLKAHNAALEQLVFTDALTQVSSRHYMEQRAELEISRCHEQNLNLSLVVFDLDNFKAINDQYGHAAGDQALQQICATAKAVLRRHDVIARFGGDEFVLLLPGTDQQQSNQLIERIQTATANITIGLSQLSCSYGIAELQPEDEFTGLFNRADRALYQAKSQGGNRISLAN